MCTTMKALILKWLFKPTEIKAQSQTQISSLSDARMDMCIFL